VRRVELDEIDPRIRGVLRLLDRLRRAHFEYPSHHHKCERNLSLADCYVLALAKLLETTAVFARRESELAKEISRSPLDVGILFLEEFAT
jgi:hypothetical protein